MTSLRGRGLWIAISLLLFAEKAHQHSYLYDDCTVQKHHKEVRIKTFRSFLNVTISRNRKDAEVKIRIGDQGERESLDLPMNKWTKIGCEYLGNDRINCSDTILDNTKSSEGELLKEWVITNADVLDNCPLGLPNKQLTPDQSESFPRWENTKENFAVTPEEDMKITMSISGERFLFCCDGNTAVVNASDGGCEDLPARETHKIIVDYDAQEIKSDDGRILKKIRITDNASDALTMEITRGKAWLVQSLGEWPELTGQDTTCDMECICNVNGSKEAVLSVLLALFIATTIALSCCLLRNRVRISPFTHSVNRH
ncbi:uncharacterized protein LOC122262061 [Penaeus japonicus]|uniref:uncharacterized protein LOC122262061 n=1 Tax=Penaeus japonicus TaxID=27405 RepID=UPI001C70D2EB|nr:uncharacterized protein LOC122262061 [Penaeus japonicus]